jgi:predicted nucleotidyltransferase
MEDLKKIILRVLAKHLDLREYHVFFFGSRVSGTSSERSDIDIGINGPRAIPHDVMSRIRDEIFELPVLYKIDIVDFQRVSSDFREVALKQIELIAP